MVAELKWQWDDKRGTARFGGMGDWAHVVFSTRRKTGCWWWVVYINHYRTGEGEERTQEQARLAAEAWEAENGTEYRKRYGGYATTEEAHRATRNFLIGRINEAREKVQAAQQVLVGAEEALAEFDNGPHTGDQE